MEQQWIITVNQFLGLRKIVVSGNESKQPASTALLSLVYAAGPPSWVTNPPKDRFSLYFVGKGEDQFFDVAKTRAIHDAASSAVRQLAREPGTDIAAFRRFIAANSVIERSYFTSGGTGSTVFYVLLRISKDVASLRFPSGNANPCVNVKIKERTWQALNLPDGTHVTVALGDLYRIARGPRASPLYILSDVYVGASGKFNQSKEVPQTNILGEIHFADVDSARGYCTNQTTESKCKFRDANGAEFNIEITKVDHECVGAGCQSITLKISGTHVE